MDDAFLRRTTSSISECNVRPALCTVHYGYGDTGSDTGNSDTVTSLLLSVTWDIGDTFPSDITVTDIYCTTCGESFNRVGAADGPIILSWPEMPVCRARAGR